MITDKRKKLLLSIVVVLISVVAVELGLHLINLVAYLIKPKLPENPLLMYYPDKEMAETLWRETQTAKKELEFQQFTGWACKPFKGHYVNIDAEKGRKTWNPEARPAQRPKLIFFFGGSAVWGVGARDEYTIPSYLSRLLDNHGYDFTVMNFGEPGYTFSQGIIRLLLLLREGNRPDYVIFYDGFNDLYAGHQHGYPGTVHNIEMTKERLKMRCRDIIWSGMVDSFKKYCMIYNVIGGTYYNYFSETRFHEVGAKLDDKQLSSLAQGIVNDYKKSITLLDHLARAYDFRYLCFWQPSFYTESRVVSKEAQGDPRVDDRALRKICRFSCDSINMEAIPNFYSLTGALSQRRERCYVDVAHLSESGNEIMAEKIYEKLSLKIAR